MFFVHRYLCDVCKYACMYPLPADSGLQLHLLPPPATPIGGQYVIPIRRSKASARSMLKHGSPKKSSGDMPEALHSSEAWAPGALKQQPPEPTLGLSGRRGYSFFWSLGFRFARRGCFIREDILVLCLLYCPCVEQRSL